VPLTIDWDSSIINVTSPTVAVAGQDLHDFIEDAMASPEGLLYGDILKPEGKIEDPTNPGVYSQIILLLNSPWQIQFWAGSGYTRLYGAKLVGGLSDQPMKATGTAGDITVLESPVDGVTVVSGSAVTEQDKVDIAEKVWEEDLHGYTSGAGKIILALLYGKEVLIDTVNGVAGTDPPTGTRGQPSNNLTDALAICAARGLIRIMTRSDLIIEPTHNIDRIVIATHGIMGTDLVFQSGCSAKWATLRNINVSGVLTNGDVLLIEDCSIGNLANFTGIMNVCAFGEGCEISLGPWANMIECYCGGEPANEPEISLNSAALSMPCYCGNLKFTNKTGGPSTVASFRSGSVSITSSCVAGKIKILGTGELEKDDSGPGCQVDVDWAAIVSENIKSGSFGELLSLIGHIEGGRWKIDVALNQMVFYDETNAVEVARFDLKDAAGNPAYENVMERVRVGP
jgi:hypothetical protein